MASELIGKIKQLPPIQDDRVVAFIDKLALNPVEPQNPEGFQAIYQKLDVKEKTFDQQQLTHEKPSEESVRKTSMIDQISEIGHKIATRDFAALSPTEQSSLLQLNVEKTIAQLQRIQAKEGVSISLPKSTGKVLLDKAENINRNIQSLGKEIGSELPINQDMPSGPNPIKKFFGYLTHGQVSLQQVGQDIASMDPKGFSMTQMLRVQIKILNIQQELDFFANVLNKGLESTKSLMNVQI